MYPSITFPQLVAQRLKVKSMESRIEIDEQYNDDMRDTRTLRQKVSSYTCTYMYMYMQ